MILALINGSCLGITPGVNPDDLKWFFQEVRRVSGPYKKGRVSGGWI